ncbi:flagellar motor protein MotB [Bacillus solimangrovi]|uniref:Flagellar motor protein MotB n=1 Tax=Bacillus solimangrovi TaxID=1305675 RepID=A0A1E5LHH5_9BACI|nr:flagellar motor protein MotB [Bacillus solimangrovi]OEH93534.1 flagellar motor protein MotB [Bacillus solimangrovi]
MAKRKKKDDGHIDETWLIPYADMLTLLLALFIVLFAASNVDAQKFQKISASFNDAFKGGIGIMDQPFPVQPENPDLLETEEKKHLNQQSDLNELEEQIQTYIESNNLNDNLTTSLTSEGLLITILNDAFFASGSAKVTGETDRLAHELGSALATKTPHDVIISGHTDNLPINNAEFDSNWHLSVIRAVNFMKILLENDQLNPEYFSAKGYGEFKPIASNDTPENRQKNRRVEVLILPNEPTETERQVNY